MIISENIKPLKVVQLLVYDTAADEFRAEALRDSAIVASSDEDSLVNDWLEEVIDSRGWKD